MKLIRRGISEYADEAGTPRIDMSAVLVKPVPMTPFADADLAAKLEALNEKLKEQVSILKSTN